MNIVSFSNKIFYFIFHPESVSYIIYLKIIFFVFIVGFSIFIIVFLLKTSWLRALFLENLVEFLTYKPFGSKSALKKWGKIIKKLESGEESEYKLAIIEADDFFQEALDKEDYKGETIEEKVKQIGQIVLSNIDEIIQAHQTRNKIVYDPNYQLTLEEAKKVIGYYETALRDLDLL